MIAVVRRLRTLSTTRSACVSTTSPSRRTRSRRPWHEPPQPSQGRVLERAARKVTNEHLDTRLVSHRQWQAGRARSGTGNHADDDRFPARVSEPHRFATWLRHRCLPRLHGHPRSIPTGAPRNGVPGSRARNFFAGKSIRTIEGHARARRCRQGGKLSRRREAFIENFSFQCGYCTPGFVTGATVPSKKLEAAAGGAPGSRGRHSRGAGPAYLPLHRLRPLLRSSARGGAGDAGSGEGLNDAVGRHRRWPGHPRCACASPYSTSVSCERSVVSSDLDAPLTTEARGKLAAKGRYLVVAADCYACHTYRDGPPWAGGLPFDTPFGTIHATNISPDPENGIGKWTRRDFHRALRDGIAPGAGTCIRRCRTRRIAT